MERSRRRGRGRGENPGEASGGGASEPFTPADLPIDEHGRIYHLQLKPEQIASDILLVGDPGRAEMIGATFLEDIEVEHEHRGLVTVTGTARVSGEPATIVTPLRTTVTTSGMGAPSLEIVVNELVALNEIDFATRTRKPTFPRLHIIRVGSSGALQTSTRLGTPIITTYAIGLDNTGLYYEAAYADENCQRLENELEALLKGKMSKASRFYGKLHPYVARAEPALVQAMVQAAAKLGVSVCSGLTVSAPGFFAPQGREIARVKPSLADLDKILAEYEPCLDGQRIENMEMEGSLLLHFSGSLGYWGGVICPVVSHRRENTFDHHYQEAMKRAIQVALLGLAIARKGDADAG